MSSDSNLPHRLKDRKCPKCGGTMVAVWHVGDRITVEYLCRSCRFRCPITAFSEE